MNRENVVFTNNIVMAWISAIDRRSRLLNRGSNQDKHVKISDLLETLECIVITERFYFE